MALQGGHRLLFLSLIILGLWIAAWATGVTGRFTSESIRSFIAARDIWGIVAFIVVFSGGQLLPPETHRRRHQAPTAERSVQHT